jgi:hypothetical protein
MTRLKPEMQRAIEWQYEQALEDVKRRMNEMRKDSEERRLEQKIEQEMERQFHRLQEPEQGKNWE